MISMNDRPKLMVIGYAEHGKGTAIKLLDQIFELTGTSSSHFANERVVYPIIKDVYGYATPEECYNDRYQYREVWFNLIKQYNTPDGCRLARELYQQYDIYDGCRNIEEFNAIKEAKLFDHSIWIDASKRKPIEDKSSCTIKPSDADWVIDNNKPPYYMVKQLIDLILVMYPRFR